MKDKREKKKNVKKRSGGRRTHPILLTTTVCAILLALLALAFDQFQMNRFEEGLLDVCAVQQDAYVQLVLDQININQHRDVEDIIDILETMDGSSNKYWTFSREQSMLFVKDVLETNRYQGFTTATYYISESASEFLDSLQVNRVIHKNIEIQEKEYIASGVAFTYNGENYRLCLLTNKSVMLDNNKLLRAKTELNILFICLILLLISVPMIYASKVHKLQVERDEQTDVITELNSNMTRLNRLLSEQDLHDTRHNVWSGEALDDFAEKLKERNTVPSTIIKIRCGGEETAQKLLDKAGAVLDKTVLRFWADEEAAPLVSFLFVGSDYETAMGNIEILLSDQANPATLEERLCLTEDRYGTEWLSPEEMNTRDRRMRAIRSFVESRKASKEPDQMKSREQQLQEIKNYVESRERARRAGREDTN